MRSASSSSRRSGWTEVSQSGERGQPQTELEAAESADYIDFEALRPDAQTRSPSIGSGRAGSVRAPSFASSRSSTRLSPRVGFDHPQLRPASPVRRPSSSSGGSDDASGLPGRFTDRPRDPSRQRSISHEPRSTEQLAQPPYFQNWGRLGAGQNGVWQSERRESTSTEREANLPIVRKRSSDLRMPIVTAPTPPRDKRASLGILFPPGEHRRQSTGDLPSNKTPAIHAKRHSMSSSPRGSTLALPPPAFEPTPNSRRTPRACGVDGGAEPSAPMPPPKSARRPTTFRVSSGETTPMPSTTAPLARVQTAPANGTVQGAAAHRIPNAYFPPSPLGPGSFTDSPTTDEAFETDVTGSPALTMSPHASESHGSQYSPELPTRSREQQLHRQAKRLTAEADRLGAWGADWSSTADEDAVDESPEEAKTPATISSAASMVDASEHLDRTSPLGIPIPPEPTTSQSHPIDKSRPGSTPPTLSKLERRMSRQHPPPPSPRRISNIKTAVTPPPSPPHRQSSLNSPRGASPISTSTPGKPRRTRSDESEKSERTEATSLYESVGSRDDLLETNDTFRLKDLPATPVTPTAGPQSALPALSAAEEAEQKRASKRRRAIQELVETERAYAQDLALARDVYMARAGGAPISAIRTYLQSSGFAAPPTPNQVHEFDGRRSQQTPRTPTAASGAFVPSPLPSPSELPAMSAQDIKTIFINLPDLAQFAEAFSGLVDVASGIEGTSANEDHLGATFLEMIPRIAQLYKPYCSRHGLALQRLEEMSPGLEVYFKECQQICSGLSHAWSANALLVKPVQRCLKYPLLLEQILASTPADHPDHSNLKLALERMLSVAHELNEAKRRKELVGRVINGRSNSLNKPTRSSKSSQGVARDAHESRRSGVVAESSSSTGQKVMKKLMRSGTKAKLAAGYDTSVAGDAENSAALDLLIARFSSQSKALDAIIPDSLGWVHSMQRWLDAQRIMAIAWSETFAPLPGEQDVRGGGFDALRQFKDAITHCRDVACQEAANKINLVIAPNVQRLRTAYNGPKTVINKRKDKLLDRQRAAASKKGLDQNVEDDYTALTICLTEDLPTFVVKTQSVFDEIVATLAKIQTDLYTYLHTVLRGFEVSHCFVFGDTPSSEALVAAWEEAIAPIQAHVDDLPITRFRSTRTRTPPPGSSQSLRPQISRSSLASTRSDLTHSAMRAQSMPGVPLPEAGDVDALHIRRSTADATVPDGGFLRPQPRPHPSPAASGSWYRKSRTRSIFDDQQQQQSQTTPSRPNSATTPPVNDASRSSFASSSPSIAFSQAAPSSAASASTTAREFDASHLPSLYVGVITRSTVNEARGKSHEGQPLLELEAGAQIECLYEAGTNLKDGTPIWIYARKEGERGIDSTGFVRGVNVVALR